MTIVIMRYNRMNYSAVSPQNLILFWPDST